MGRNRKGRGRQLSQNLEQSNETQETRSKPKHGLVASAGSVLLGGYNKEVLISAVVHKVLIKDKISVGSLLLILDLDGLTLIGDISVENHANDVAISIDIVGIAIDIEIKVNSDLLAVEFSSGLVEEGVTPGQNAQFLTTTDEGIQRILLEILVIDVFAQECGFVSASMLSVIMVDIEIGFVLLGISLGFCRPVDISTVKFIIDKNASMVDGRNTNVVAVDVVFHSVMIKESCHISFCCEHAGVLGRGVLLSRFIISTNKSSNG